MRKKHLVKIILRLFISLLILSCSSESIFSQLGELEKITTGHNVLATSSPSGISRVGNTLYIAAMHLWKKENGQIEKVDFSDTYEFVIDLVNIAGDTYLLSQNKDQKLELYKLNGTNFNLVFEKDLQPLGFLKEVTATGVTAACIHAQNPSTRKQSILDLPAGNDITPSTSNPGDVFYTMSNEGKLVTSNGSRLWDLANNNTPAIVVAGGHSIMPIISTSIRGTKETLVMTGGFAPLNTNFTIYSSNNSYQTEVWNKGETGGFSSYFAREYKGTILIGGSSGFAELIHKGSDQFELKGPHISVEPGAYQGSQISKTGLSDIIPVSSDTLFILTKGKGLWKLENKKLTKE